MPSSPQNQAFSPSHIKSIIPIFREKAERVCIPFNSLLMEIPVLTTLLS